MEFRTLETFLAVAELKSFSKAAEKLGYSQSAVTMQIQKLERELGVRLFDRMARGAALTEQGRLFSFHAHEVLRAAERAVGSVRTAGEASPSEAVGVLRIGSAESISTALLPELLACYHSEFPHVELIVQTARREQLVERVRSNSIDLFLTMEEPVSAPGLTRVDLREEDIVFVAPASWDRGSESPLSASSLLDLPFVLTERGESYRRELDRLMGGAGSIVPVVEAGNTETLVHLVERGVGLSFLPRFSVGQALQSGTVKLVSTELPPVRMSVQMVYHRSKWLAPYMRSFVDLTKARIGGNHRPRSGMAEDDAQ